MENTSNLTKAIVINELDNDTSKNITSDAEINITENNNSHNSATSTPLKDNIKPIDSEKTLNEIVEQSAEIEANSEESDKAIDAGTPGTLNDESVTNASTEVLLDVSISDRLAGLSVADASPVGSSNHLDASSKSDDESASNKADPNSHGKIEKSAELCRSILAGEVSDNSECSVEEDEASDYVDDKVVSGDSDEEMFIEDQDEDVEEEEEFHEVEEEKHKTSQESVGNVKTASSPRATAKSSPPIDNVKSSPSDTAAPTSKLTAEAKTTDGLSTHVDEPEVTVQKPAAAESPSTSGDSNSKTTISVSNDGDKACDNVTSEILNDGKSQVSKGADWADLMQSNEPSSTSCLSAEEPSNEKLAELNAPAEQDEEVEKDAEEQAKEIVEKDSEEDVKKGEPEGDVEKKEPEGDAEKKELDLDEDVKNPQYIPKKGVFYEHDDRSHDVNNKKQPPSSSKKDEETTEAKEPLNIKKTTTQEKQVDNRRGSRRQRTENDRWNHDLFKDEKQKPKSKSELINAYGYDIRQERGSRNYGDNRNVRTNSNTTNDRQQQGSQENHRSRPIRDNRSRQNQPINRSRERRQRRPTNRIRNEAPGGTPPKPREAPNTRLVKPDLKDVKQDYVDGKQGFPSAPNQIASSSARRDYQEGPRDRIVRNDIRGRRLNSKDRPAASNLADDKLPPINTVMPPITTWSNKIEDMVKEEASRKESPSRLQQQPQPQHSQAINNTSKARSHDYWPQNQPNKTSYHERPVRNIDDGRHQQQPQQQPHYNSRRYQDRDDAHRTTQFVNRNHYNDRSNQHHQEWRRTNQYGSNHAKSSEYEPIKTQTFENSRLSQSNMNRQRDAREIINERRMHNQQNFQPKVQPISAGPEQQKQQLQQLQQRHPPPLQQQQQHPQQHQQQQPPQSQHPHQHQHLQQLVQHQQHMQQLQHQQALNLHQQPGPQQQLRQPSQQQPEPNQQQQQSQQPPQVQPPPAQQQQQLQNQRSHQTQAPQATQHQTQQRPGIATNNMNDGVQSEPGRLNANNPPNANDLINSRPIIKTDAYTGTNVGQHAQQPQSLQQHSQNHRSLGGSMSQGPGSAGSHIVPQHLGAGGTQAQYYSPTSNSRDPAAAAAAAAALASAYHGYMPGGHSVMDANRYHMTPQQLSEHGYMTSPGQANDVAAASVMLPQGMYSDAASAGGTVASSAYLAQAGSTLSPSTNIPVTGAGPPSLAPVSYLQHSQYAPPPYTNPYSQPQHNNQAPPQSSHAYPYWTYI